MGKLYNSVMVGCTTLLEKFFKRRVDLEFHLLNGADGGLPTEPAAGFWQSPHLRADPKLVDDSNAMVRWVAYDAIDGTVDMPSSSAGIERRDAAHGPFLNPLSNLVSDTTRITRGGLAHSWQATQRFARARSPRG